MRIPEGTYTKSSALDRVYRAAVLFVFESHQAPRIYNLQVGAPGSIQVLQDMSY